ncbi:MAG: hypothetical protein PVSMB8_00600 [Vulcanimicrobiaceae bacterium]
MSCTAEEQADKDVLDAVRAVLGMGPLYANEEDWDEPRPIRTLRRFYRPHPLAVDNGQTPRPRIEA